MVSYLALGIFGGAKGAHSYGANGLLGAANMLAYPIYSLVPALFLSAFLDFRGRWRTWGACLLVAMVAMFSMMQFGRQSIVFTVLVLVVIYNARVGRIKGRVLFLLFVGLILLSLVALLRSLGVGATELSFAQIYDALVDGDVSIGRSFEMIGQAIPGQAVFSNVVEIMEDTDYFWGGTYIQSILGFVLPEGFFEYPQAAVWYKDIYAPYVEGHGFDYSMFSEAYMNFGLPGVFLLFFVGLFVGLASSAVRRSSNPIIVVWAAILIVNLIVGLRNDSVPVLTRAIVYILPLIFWRYAFLDLVKLILGRSYLVKDLGVNK